MVSLTSMYAVAGSIPWARCKRQPRLIIAGGLLGAAHLRQIGHAPQLRAPKNGRKPGKFHSAVRVSFCRLKPDPVASTANSLKPKRQRRWSKALVRYGVDGRSARRCWGCPPRIFGRGTTPSRPPSHRLLVESRQRSNTTLRLTNKKLEHGPFLIRKPMISCADHASYLPSQQILHPPPGG